MTLTCAGRHRTAIFAGMAALVLGITPGADAGSVSLREQASVAGPMVTLGDIFRGVPADQQTREVIRAPEPGRTRSLNAGLLNNVAAESGLDWRTQDSGKMITVRRKSQNVPTSVVKAAVRRALEQQGVGGERNVVLSNPNVDLVIPVTVPKTVRLEDFTYRRSSNRFSARVHAPATGSSQARETITGELVRMVQVPVLQKRVSRDERVQEDDITWVTRPESEIRSNTITDADALVGNIARRPLSSNELLRRTAVEEPVLVERNSLVTIKLQTEQMSLTARGRAMEDGTMNDTVRVENTQSEQTVTGVVIGSGVVAVKPNGTPTN